MRKMFNNIMFLKTNGYLEGGERLGEYGGGVVTDLLHTVIRKNLMCLPMATIPSLLKCKRSYFERRSNRIPVLLFLNRFLVLINITLFLEQ